MTILKAKQPPRVAIVGGGPAGLMAAETISAAGIACDIYDAMPSVGRKFLQAGRGGLNITHSEPDELFLTRYDEAMLWLSPMLRAFDSKAIQAWVQSFGIETFVGSSGRVFPAEKKAAPLLRAWVNRLKQQGCHFHVKHRLIHWCDASLHSGQQLTFSTPIGEVEVVADAVVFAVGGASWPKLGSTGEWTALFDAKQIARAPFIPANCGFQSNWSAYLKQLAGEPIKPVAIRCNAITSMSDWHKGELMLTETGLEGGLIYRFSKVLRDALYQEGGVTVELDLMPDISMQEVERRLSQQGMKKSRSQRLKQSLSLSSVKLALINEYIVRHPEVSLAQLVKQLPINLVNTSPMEEAISTAGGVCQVSVNEDLMLHAQEGCFCAGEMLDWEAPTGGYLLTAVLASGCRAGQGVIKWLSAKR